MKFKKGDRIIDSVAEFGNGTIVDLDSYAYDDDDRVFYIVDYDGMMGETTGCPEDEMRLLTKLDKALK